ncbi:phage tail protein [Erwinia psidii]|uniref:phage tail sheath C-terminal domain-containing protein n=1 Tax=Erwinia psidii TaxID=69224 RepID=UPI00226B012A|nr:phage tail sheath C-terminal domain-containing protein [Erwinia psidii]MCX8957225.1 phage tail protein [Erwinia psidii]
MTLDITSIPNPIYKPGAYFGFNTTLASKALATNDQKLLIIGQRIADSATVNALTPVNVFSDDEAAIYFGRGSQAHRMASAAIRANQYIQLTVIGLDDDAAAVKASASLTLAGTASSSGQVRLNIGGTTVSVVVAAGDQRDAMQAALMQAINAEESLPLKASAGGGPPTEDGEVTSNLILTAKNKGTCGNEIGLAVTVTASGVTPTLKPMSGGQGDPSLSDALSAVYASGHTIIMMPYTSDDALAQLAEHLDSVSGPLEQRGAIGVTGWNGTLASGTTLTAKVNAVRITCGWHAGSALPNGELAAIYGAIIASESDPARPLNTLTLPGLDITAQDNWPGRTEQENALMNGLTPFEVDGSVVRIVRSVSTYVKNAAGVTDRTMMDITIIRSLDYVRLACRTRYTQRFPREKLTDARLTHIRSELLDVLYALESLEIVENVDALKDQLRVTRSTLDDTRAEATIPAAVVRGLHIFAAVIYLM